MFTLLISLLVGLLYMLSVIFGIFGFLAILLYISHAMNLLSFELSPIHRLLKKWRGKK